MISPPRPFRNRRPDMRRLHVALVPLLAACLLVPLGAQQQPAGLVYRILISNDDGVRADGIRHVASILQAIGNVTVIAPSQNQSGKGHSIITSEPVFREDVTLANGLPAIGLTATPATTVNIAIRNIMQP